MPTGRSRFPGAWLRLLAAAGGAAALGACGSPAVRATCLPDGERDLCDGRDNDCDGEVDEDDPAAGAACATGLAGACAQGSQKCVYGRLRCEPEHAAQEETCDGVDNDCDFAVDEDATGQRLTQPCFSGDRGWIGRGPCREGVAVCEGGRFGACIGEVLPGEEVCDGQDNDCDGREDETASGAPLARACYTGAPATAGVGACHPGAAQCESGEFGDCEGQALPSDERCNGADDDCDGETDEGDPENGEACASGGAGVCAPGHEHCVGGALRCTPDREPGPEICDNQDNDCDGRADEDDPGGGDACTTEKKGACRAGTLRCRDGALGCVANALPGAESCDGADNDCDGETDEGDPGGGGACDTGLAGACRAGERHCRDGAVRCVQTVFVSAERCDGIDDDCDQQTDEEFAERGQSCNTSAMGECRAGTRVCNAGALACAAVLEPAPEKCDGLDNDCDGQTDDGNPEGGADCDTGLSGACRAGARTCVAGALRCEARRGPEAEACDFVDNDCDGQTDEDDPGGGRACNTGEPGTCSAGTTKCELGSVACKRDRAPTQEVCDGADDDCDGLTDETDPQLGIGCDTGRPGQCAEGKYACTGARIVCESVRQPAAETCDLLDNDCDAGTDEGNPESGQVCNTGEPGVCAAGATTCRQGQIECRRTGEPGDEVCDGLDNDCDRSTDENDPGGGGSCTTGEPGICAAGTQRCTGGRLVCARNLDPRPEVCDGIDDDCDGTADDGNPGGGVDCNTGEQGACARGKTACTNGRIVCNRVASPQTETCNNADDNCDGATDEGNPGGGASCTTSEKGVCAPGTTTCAGGAIACVRNVQPSAETCDKKDNDCDGATDEQLPTYECGTCDPNCHQVVIGDDEPLPLPGDPGGADVTSDGIVRDPGGGLALEQTGFEFRFLWIANNVEGTLSKLDTRTGREVGRYVTVRSADAPGTPPPGEVCDDGAHTGNCPSRTAVDFNGDVWVANRAYWGQGSATKVANATTDCIDRNGNGSIETSKDVDGDGRINPDCNGDGLKDDALTICTELPRPEYLGENDECVVRTMKVGGPTGLPRAVAIDAGTNPDDPGDVWVGAYNEQAMYEYDGRTGALIRRVPATGVLGAYPYGAAIDSRGRLWVANGCCGNNGIMSIDTATGQNSSVIYVDTPDCGGGYGIAIDGKDRVWLGGWPCDRAFRYDPDTQTWMTAISGLGSSTWGVRGLNVDGRGRVWAAMHRVQEPEFYTETGKLAAFDADTGALVGLYDLTDGKGNVCQTPVGAGADFDGSIWAVCQASSNAARLYVDPTTGQPARHPTTGNMVDLFPVGTKPYTYSDFTGFGLRNFTRAAGSYAIIVESACPAGWSPNWDTIEWSATTPTGSRIEAYTRSGSDKATISTQTQYGPFAPSPASLSAPPKGPVPASRYLQATLRFLSTNRSSNPVLSGLRVTWICAAP